MNHIWSEALYQYAISKNYSCAIRMTCNMIDIVDANILKNAIKKAEIRYPYLKVKRIKNKKEIALENNELDWVLINTDKSVTLGSNSSNNHLLAFSYKDTYVYLDIFHGLTDGHGVNNLMKTILYYYCSEKYNKNINCFDINLIEDKIDDLEYKDPFYEFYNDNNDIEIPKSKKAIKPLIITKTKNVKKTNNYRYYLELNEEEYVEYCKREGGSPATVASLLLGHAIDKQNKKRKKPIIGALAIDARRGFKTNKSHHSSVLTFYYRYDDMLHHHIDTQISTFRSQIDDMITDDNLKIEIAKMNVFFKFISGIKRLFFKKLIMKSIIKMSLGKSTYVVSYVGKSNMGDIERYLNSAYLEAEAPGVGIMVEIFAISGKICISFSQEFKEDKYFKGFIAELTQRGIHHKVVESKEQVLSKMELI